MKKKYYAFKLKKESLKDALRLYGLNLNCLHTKRSAAIKEAKEAKSLGNISSKAKTRLIKITIEASELDMK